MNDCSYFPFFKTEVATGEFIKLKEVKEIKSKRDIIKIKKILDH